MRISRATEFRTRCSRSTCRNIAVTKRQYSPQSFTDGQWFAPKMICAWYVGVKLSCRSFLAGSKARTRRKSRTLTARIHRPRRPVASASLAGLGARPAAWDVPQ
jgi:hypothetical protein